MDHVNLQMRDGIATLILSRGKVNAIDGDVVDQLRGQLQSLKVDREVKAIILTGSGKFFSFGFDIPEFLSFSREQFRDYLQNFTGLYTTLFRYPKPVVAAINGHAIAGGCMLALACDQRVMVTGKARIALNEIGFGASLLAGATEMLRFAVGNSNATKILYSGALYSAEDALGLGLVDQVASESDLMDMARRSAAEMGSKHPPAFAGIKNLLRGPIVEEMNRRENQSIEEFIRIWYSETTWANLQNIRIY
jgi:Delta3-Delta2-enoyl-CoA isomerase